MTQRGFESPKRSLGEKGSGPTELGSIGHPRPPWDDDNLDATGKKPTPLRRIALEATVGRCHS